MFTNQLKPKETDDDDQAIFDPLTFVYTSRKDLYGQITPLFIGFGIIFVLVIFRELQLLNDKMFSNGDNESNVSKK